VSDDIVEASTPADYAAFGEIVKKYIAWQQVRYAGYGDLADRIFANQSIDHELANLAKKYGPPAGVTLLATREEVYTGAAAYRDLGDGTCEMKRMFVLDEFQGAGTGRALCTELLEHARSAGFTKMRLDTGVMQHEAIAMYRRLGFVECRQYNAYPDEFLPILIWMEKDLSAQP
jgi:GNAT superfamily N-acetyltransferase